MVNYVNCPVSATAIEAAPDQATQKVEQWQKSLLDWKLLDAAAQNAVSSAKRNIPDDKGVPIAYMVVYFTSALGVEKFYRYRVEYYLVPFPAEVDFLSEGLLRLVGYFFSRRRNI